MIGRLSPPTYRPLRRLDRVERPGRDARYMEQTPLYNAINFGYCGGYGYGVVVNITAYTTHQLVPLPVRRQRDKGGRQADARLHGRSAEHQQLPRQRRHDHVPLGN